MYVQKCSKYWWLCFVDISEEKTEENNDAKEVDIKKSVEDGDVQMTVIDDVDDNSVGGSTENAGQHSFSRSRSSSRSSSKSGILYLLTYYVPIIPFTVPVTVWLLVPWSAQTSTDMPRQ